MQFYGLTKSFLIKLLHRNTLSTDPTKWSITLKQFVSCCRQIVWVCLTIFLRLPYKRVKIWNADRIWPVSQITLLRRESNYLAMHFGRSSHWRRSIVFIANFEHIPHLVLVLLLLTLQVNAGCYYNLTFM